MSETIRILYCKSVKYHVIFCVNNYFNELRRLFLQYILPSNWEKRKVKPHHEYFERHVRMVHNKHLKPQFLQIFDPIM